LIGYSTCQPYIIGEKSDLGFDVVVFLLDILKTTVCDCKISISL